jgi:hypothetical protein
MLNRLYEIIKWDMSKYIILYVGLICIVLIAFLIWKKKQVTDPNSTINLNKVTTKRQKAIEAFQAMSKSIIESKANKAYINEQTQRLAKRALTQKCSSVINTPLPTLPLKPSYVLPEIHRAITDRIIVPDTKRQPLVDILNDNLFSIDEAISKTATKLYTDFSAEYSTADRNNVFLKETVIEQLTNELDAAIKTFTETTIENMLYDIFYNPNLADESQPMLFIYKVGATNPIIFLQNRLITREIKERLFAQISNDSRRYYRDLCIQDRQITDQEQELVLGTTNIPEINKQLDTLKLSAEDNNAKYRLALLVLLKIAPSQTTKSTVQSQLENLASLQIQPKSISQSDVLRGAPVVQLESGKYASPGEQDLTRQYTGAYQEYQDYLKAQDKHYLAAPLNILSRLENQTVNLLTQKPDANAAASGDIVKNRFGTQTNTLGTWMQGQQNLLSPSSNLGKPMTDREVSIISSNKQQQQQGSLGTTNQDTGIIEGFETSSNPTTNKTQNKTLQQHTRQQNTNQASNITGTISGFSNYVLNIVSGLAGPENVASIKSIFNNDENMVAIGFVLIILSVFLYFIDISS